MRIDPVQQYVTIVRSTSLIVVLLVFAVSAGCDAEGQGTRERSLAQDCSTVSAPPDSLGLDPFYEKYCPAEGLPVVSAEQVPDAALTQAGDIVTHMLENLPDVRDALLQSNVRAGVIGADQVTTDMPEYSDLDDHWDDRARGLGATPERPLVSAGEENLLCYSDDRYAGESILVHEFAHTIKGMGLEVLDPSFADHIQELYDRALEEGRWTDTYAATNPGEYWAEGVQSYFNANLEADSPDGVHNHVNTRSELEEYDPALFAVIDSTFEGLDWSPTCP